MLAAYRQQTGDVPIRSHDPAQPDWPHGEVPRLYTAIASVAAAAGLALMVMELVRHHTRVELAVEVVVAAASGLMLARMLARLVPGPGQSRQAPARAANR
jgi:hypothetical protein